MQLWYTVLRVTARVHGWQLAPHEHPLPGFVRSPYLFPVRAKVGHAHGAVYSVCVVLYALARRRPVEAIDELSALPLFRARTKIV